MNPRKNLRSLVALAVVAGLVLGTVAWITRTDRGADASAPVLDIGERSEPAEPIDRATEVQSASSSPTPLSSVNASVTSDGGAPTDDREEAQQRAERDYEAIRAPVVNAIRRIELGPLDRRAAILEAMEASGASDEPFTRTMPGMVAAWIRGLPRDAMPLDSGAPRCFRAGCETTLRFRDEASYRAAAAAYRAIDDPGAEHGGRVQTPPAVREDGTIEVVWIALRPAPAL